MKTHALDLMTLVESLSQQSALLNTPILDTLPGFAGACRGWVQVQKGTIASCMLEGVNGERMEGEHALSRLRSVKEWQVTLEMDAQHSSFPSSGTPTEQTLPVTPRFHLVPRRRVAAVSPALLASLPRKERMLLSMVFTMVNGQRGTEQIKAQLHVSAERIDAALRTLWNMHVIEYISSSSS